MYINRMYNCRINKEEDFDLDSKNVIKYNGITTTKTNLYETK